MKQASLLAILLALARCTTAPPVVPAAPVECKTHLLRVGVTASRLLDPAPDLRPRPIEIRLYLLKSDAALTASSFRQVWLDDRGTMKDELISSKSLAVYPDSHVDVALEQGEDAAFLAAVALFREPKERSWRSVLSLEAAAAHETCQSACPQGDCQAPSACDVCLGFALDETRIETSTAGGSPAGRR
jgi:type VI secretion system VasD/TssJ family lipoprotein